MGLRGRSYDSGSEHELGIAARPQDVRMAKPIALFDAHWTS